MATTNRRPSTGAVAESAGAGARASASADGADWESLEQERQFLLRSLADLDAEHAAGDLDDDDYEALSNDYTARAAAVLKAIEALGARPARGAAGARTATTSVAGTRRAPQRTATTSVAGTRRATANGRGAPPVGQRRPGVATHRRPAAVPATEAGSDPHLDPDPDLDPDFEDDDADEAAAGPAGSTRKKPSRSAGDGRGDGRGDGNGHDRGELASLLASRRRWRTAAIVGSAVIFGVLAVWAVVGSSGNRQPGQTITGNKQISGGPTTTIAGGVDARLTQAADDSNKGDYLDAIKLYDAILKDDPNQPVALADEGWLEAQVGLASNQPNLVTTGLATIVKAENADSSYAEPHFFRGYVLLKQNDAPGAVTEFRNFMGRAEQGDPNISEAQTLLQQAITAAGPNVPPGPNAATTTTKP